MSMFYIKVDQTQSSNMTLTRALEITNDTNITAHFLAWKLLYDHLISKRCVLIVDSGAKTISIIPKA